MDGMEETKGRSVVVTHSSSIHTRERWSVRCLAAVVVVAAAIVSRVGMAATLSINGVNGSVVVRQGVGAETTVAKGVVTIPDGTTVELIPRPQTGYCFQSWSGDLSGSRLMMRLVMDADKSVGAHFATWRPPIGIPAPSFGIFESYRMYDDPGKRNPALAYSQNAEGGFYTHYVDNTHPQATNTSNPVGTAAKPRTSLPAAANVPPGSVIELHGGPYALGYTIYTVVGTAEQPIFLRGHSQTERVSLTSGALYFNVQYFIIENIRRESPIYFRSFVDRPSHHVAARNCEVTRTSTGVSAACWDAGEPVHHMVAYNNYVHLDNFDPNGPDFPEDDEGGVHISDKSEDVWIVDNYLHTIKGDAVGAGHAANYTAKRYYVGRNVMHTCGENAIDLKEVDTVIISQNLMYNFRGWSSGSDGTGAVFHYGPTYSPMNVWFIFNEVFECTDKGIQAGGDQEHPVYLIGNVVHDVHNTTSTGRAFATWGCREVYFVNNVFYNVDNGIQWGTQGTSPYLFFAGNIVSNVAPGGYHLYVEASGQQQNADITDSIFQQPGGNAVIRWGGASYTVAQWQGVSGKGAGCMDADPRFVNPSALNFRLQASSSAIDHTGEDGVYALFSSLFGLDIRRDFAGRPRPRGPAWDIGAHEYIPPGVGAGFWPVIPCRVLDTRVTSGASAAAPMLDAGERRVFAVGGWCGIPSEAVAISGNLTVVGAVAVGDLRVTGGHLTATGTSALSIPITRARANNAIVQLSTIGDGTIAVTNDSGGGVHFILDVDGYFL
jgi:hypothetical protein